MATASVTYNSTEIGKDSWVRWLVDNTMKRNKNNLVAVTGPTGSGKSWAAISICKKMEKIDKVPFTDEHIVFSFKQLIDIATSGKLVRGTKLVYDEPQVTVNAKEWQSQANRTFNYLMSTFRSMNVTIFFCLPFESYLDSDARKLLHVRMKTARLNEENSTCWIRPYFLEHVDFKKTPYTKYLRVNFKNPETDDGWDYLPLKLWGIEKAPDEILKQYETKKALFLSHLVNNIKDDFTKAQKRKNYGDKAVINASGAAIIASTRKKLTSDQEKNMKILAKVGTLTKVAEIENKNVSTIMRSIKLAEKKGWTVDDFKEKPEVEPKI